MNAKIKDFLYGVKSLKLKHLSNGYITGGTELMIVCRNEVICKGQKMDFKDTEKWKQLRRAKICRLLNHWEDYDGLVIMLDMTAKKLAKLKE